MVLIDEATQAIEPDTLLPLYHKAQMVVMIGDEKQLGPTVKSQEANIAGLGISLFERLCFYYKGSSFISNLNEQYRMHSTLYEFSNKHFYDNMMKTHGEIQLDENVKNNFPWPNKDIPTFFYNNVETEKIENYSYYN
jgi:regulator of nonsense transcripts 1